MALDPNDPLALAHNRHPVTEAGLARLTDQLIAACRADLGQDGATTVLDRVHDDEGRLWFRSTQTYARPRPECPFARVEVEFDPEARLPSRISAYERPQPGPSGEPVLAERYAFDHVKLGAPLTDADFDPDSPAYAFTRF
jgi:hypothetical protein